MPLSWSAPPRLVAHRGASAEAPENTIAAFERALLSTPAIELDVHRTADGVPVVIHDATLDRTTDGSGAVVRLKASDVARWSAGAWRGAEFAAERVPTLAAVLDAFGPRSLLDVEIKDETLAEDVGALVLERGLRDRVLVTSFDWDAARAFKIRYPEIRAGVVAAHAASAAEVESVAPWADALAVARDSILDDTVAAAKRQGLLVLAWTVDDPGEAAALLRRGVDAIVTNDPARLARAL